MRKTLAIVIVGLVVLAVGANWYYTREIRQQLDRTAAAVAMFGTLDYDSVRLSPAGAIHINGLEFVPRQGGNQGIRIGRIALRTGSLGALFSLDKELEAGRLPAELGIGVEGLEFALGNLPISPAAGMSRPANPGPGNALPSFTAAGCAGRQDFSVDDFIDMDYYVVETDIDMHYRFLEGERRMRQTVGIDSPSIGAFDFEFVIDNMGGSRSMPALMQAWRRAGLDAFSLAYRDRGFFDRMIDFCAARMDLDRDEYIDHHLQAWTERWRSLGVAPSPSLVEAYGDFVRSPDSLRIGSRAEYSVELVMIGEYSLPQFLERMETTVGFGAARAMPLELTAIDADAAEPTGGEPAELAASEPSPEPESSASAEPVASIDARRAAAERARRAAEAAAAQQAESRWSDVGLGDAALAAVVDRPVRIVTRSGRRFIGRLERIEPERIHIRFVGDSGFYVRPVARGEIRSVATRHGVP